MLIVMSTLGSTLTATRMIIFIGLTTNLYKAAPFVKRQITHWPRPSRNTSLTIAKWNSTKERSRQLYDKVSRPTFLNKIIRSTRCTRFFKSIIAHKEHCAHRCNIYANAIPFVKRFIKAMKSTIVVRKFFQKHLTDDDWILCLKLII